MSGKVYDVTAFAPNHPGGAGSKSGQRRFLECGQPLTCCVAILKFAGRDATQAYEEVHAPSIIHDNLPPDRHVGVFDESTITPEWLKPPPSQTKELFHQGEKPPLHTLLNTYDFEEVASKTTSKKSWAFYSSAATDLITRDANKGVFDRIWFRPRVLRNVRSVSTKTRILGCETELPLMISPAAMARLVHAEGEKALMRGAAQKGVFLCVG